ncbi:MAG: hypothetical protein WDN31_18345 [Hyphomicrobium sp.]
MLRFLKALLRNLTGARDEQLHPQSPSEERISLLDVEEPMAGAGALLSGSHIKSETEKALDRASSHDGS